MIDFFALLPPKDDFAKNYLPSMDILNPPFPVPVYLPLLPLVLQT